MGPQGAPLATKICASDIRKYLAAKAQTVEHNDDEHDSDSFGTLTNSTIHYDQEPFDEFRRKVARLCAQEFNHSTIRLERLRGGTYNRITAITIVSLPPKTWTLLWLQSFLATQDEYVAAKKPQLYVLRTSRSEQSDDAWGMAYDAPTLRFARSIFGSVVPRIIRVDVDSDNPLRRPYTIQERLRGQSLALIWRSLTIAQKECALRIILDLTKKLHTITSPAAGVIAPHFIHDISNPTNLQLHTLRVGHIDMPPSIGPYFNPAILQTTVECLRDLAHRWQKVAIHDYHFSAPWWHRFNIIAQALYDKGFIPDTDMFHFCHLDLYPRNMLVEVVDSATLKLTGVLDWDAEFAHFCPAFVAYRAPFWLWLEEGDDEWDEMIATTTPKIPDLLRLKNLWEELAGEKWMRYAYTQEYMIARRLFARLRDGICTAKDAEEAKALVEEWQEMHWDERLVLPESGYGYCD
jgi:hypothetical protein